MRYQMWGAEHFDTAKGSSVHMINRRIPQTRINIQTCAIWKMVVQICEKLFARSHEKCTQENLRRKSPETVQCKK
jgi:hypothetical protein